jgi:hypothetical protein
MFVFMFLEVFLNNKPNHQQQFCIQLDVLLIAYQK